MTQQPIKRWVISSQRITSPPSVRRHHSTRCSAGRAGGLFVPASKPFTEGDWRIMNEQTSLVIALSLEHSRAVGHARSFLLAGAGTWFASAAAPPVANSAQRLLLPL
jgi:hypothetical protein